MGSAVKNEAGTKYNIACRRERDPLVRLGAAQCCAMSGTDHDMVTPPEAFPAGKDSLLEDLLDWMMAQGYLEASLLERLNIHTWLFTKLFPP